MKKFLVYAVLAALTLCLGTGMAAAAPDTMTVAMHADIRVLDPLPSTENVSANALLQMFETLLYIAPDGTLQPMLAERWEQTSPTSYRFYIKQGVKFHNGEEATAEDVKFTLDRALSPAGTTAHALIRDLDTVDVVDKYTVQLNLKRPSTPFLFALGESWAGIVNKKAVTEGDPVSQPVGTGPFKFVSWRKADRVILERFEDYHGKKPTFKNLILRAIPEASSRTIELQSGGVDVAVNIHFTDFKRIEEDKNLKLLRSPSNRTEFFELNLEKPALKDVRVRRAIKMALDIPGLQKAVWRGVGSAPTAPLSPGMQYSIAKETPMPARDLDGAKKLLEEAGVKDLKLTLVTYEFKEYQDAATIVQSMLSEAGIEVSIRVLEMGAYYDILRTGDFDISTSAWGNNLPDAEFFFGRKFHSNSIGALNYSRYNNPKFDECLELGRQAPEGPERAKAYAEAQRLLMEDVPMIPWSIGEVTVGTRANVENFEMDPRFMFRFWMANFK